MDQTKKKVVNLHEGQFLYLGRWVDKQHFRAFLYDENGAQKLANSYQEFESLTHSGVWFAEKPDAYTKVRKQKHDIARSDRK